MSGDISSYLALITSSYSSQPNFIASVSVSLQPFADEMVILNALPEDYDLDVAIGVQLDTVGQWIGQTRYLSIPLTGVYFAFDTVGVGFDQGTLFGPGDSISQLTTLPDDAYRTLLRATIAANNWDGTVPSAYDVWSTLFASTGFGILIVDNQNMTMEYALLGPVPDAVTLALFEGGYLSLKPAGVRINDFWTPSVPDTPYFGFDVETAAISGFDVGAIGLTSPGV